MSKRLTETASVWLVALDEKTNEYAPAVVITVVALPMVAVFWTTLVVIGVQFGQGREIHHQSGKDVGVRILLARRVAPVAEATATSEALMAGVQGNATHRLIHVKDRKVDTGMHARDGHPWVVWPTLHEDEIVAGRAGLRVHDQVLGGNEVPWTKEVEAGAERSLNVLIDDDRHCGGVDLCKRVVRRAVTVHCFPRRLFRGLAITRISCSTGAHRMASTRRRLHCYAGRCLEGRSVAVLRQQRCSGLCGEEACRVALDDFASPQLTRGRFPTGFKPLVEDLPWIRPVVPDRDRSYSPESSSAVNHPATIGKGD